VLNDLVERGFRRPQLFITDGNQGLLKAIKDIWPEVARQRCAIHRIRNVLARVPKKKQDEVRKALHRIFYAACLDDARDEARQFLYCYSREFPTACETLARRLEECLAFYRFPERHWKHPSKGRTPAMSSSDPLGRLREGPGWLAVSRTRPRHW